MSSQIKNRLPYLDYAKGIGIFLVVYVHAIGYLAEATEFESALKDVIYSFHMPLFFMISGIGLFYKFSRAEEIDTSAEIRRIAKRLLVPYVFWCAVDVVLWACASIIKHRSLLSSLAENAYAAVTGRLTPIWFLQTLFIAEVLFIIVLGKLRSKKCNAFFVYGALLLVLYILTVVFNYIYRSIHADDFGLLLKNPTIMLFRIPPAFLFLLFGYLFGQFITSHSVLAASRIKEAAIAIVAFIAFLAVELFSGNRLDMFHFSFGSVAVSVFTGLAGSVALLFFSMLLPANVKILSETGKESLHIMVLHHPPIMVLCTLIMLAERYSVPARPLACAAVCIAVMVMIYYFSRFIIEPVTKKLTDVVQRAEVRNTSFDSSHSS